MNLEQLISDYGYFAIVIGTFFEGESIMILAGFFSQRGYLELPMIYLYGFLGTYLSESILYMIGRTRGTRILERRPAWQKRSSRVFELLHRHQYLLIIGHRFVYGMRTITPLAVGASGIRPLSFAGLNAVGAVLWTGALGTAGFYFGRTLERYIEEIDRYDHWVIAAIAGILIAFWGLSCFFSRYVTRSG